MTSYQVNLTAVGFFVLAAVASLVATLAILAGRTGDTDRYFTIYPNVSGLKYGSQVFYEGYSVGQVERIVPVEDGSQLRFRVELSITHGWKIPEDSVARSEETSLLAPQIISIRAGHSTQMLAVGQMIPPGNSAGLLDSLSSVAGTLDNFTAQSLVPLVDNLNRQVSSVGDLIEHDVRPIVSHANEIMGAAAQHVPSILANVDQASAAFSGAAQRVNDTLSPQRLAALDRLIDNADVSAQNLRIASTDLATLTQSSTVNLQTGIADFRQTMDVFARRADVVADNLASASRNFNELGRRLRDDPGLLLRSSPPRDEAPPDPPLRAPLLAPAFAPGGQP